MFAALLSLVLALSQQPPQQQDAIAWGQSEWIHGAGPMSAHQFRYGPTFPSAHFLQYGSEGGSFYHLIFGRGAGSSRFWNYGTEAGSAYYWRYGRAEGSRYYWRYGRGCLSEFGWRHGASCSASSIITLQNLCVARAIDIEPCGPVNAGLEDWLSRASGSISGDPAAAIARMREAVD